MVLNSDCIRDVLMVVESCDFGETLTLEKLKQKANGYSMEELCYTCLKLEEGGFLQLTTVQFAGQVLPEIKSVDGLTYQGHEFIAKIRDNSQWGSIKKCVAHVKNYSLSAISAIAEGVTAAAINSYLTANH